MGKMYKINKSQLVNRKVFFLTCIYREKKWKTKLRTHCSQLFPSMETPRSQVTDPMARLRPTSISKNHMSCKKCSRSDALKSKETTIKGWSS